MYICGHPQRSPTVCVGAVLVPHTKTLCACDASTKGELFCGGLWCSCRRCLFILFRNIAAFWKILRREKKWVPPFQLAFLRPVVQVTHPCRARHSHYYGPLDARALSPTFANTAVKLPVKPSASSSYYNIAIIEQATNYPFSCAALIIPLICGRASRFPLATGPYRSYRGLRFMARSCCAGSAHSICYGYEV